MRDDSNKLIHAFAVDYSGEKPIYIDARGCTDNFESFMAAFYRDTSHSHTSHTVEYAKNVYQSICEMGSQDAFQSAMRAIGKKRDVYDAAKLGQRKPSLSSLINGALRSAAENNVQPPSRGMNISQKTQGR